MIQIWMWGGPCHLDTFDPKPEAGRDYCGPLDKPISTKVKGIRISELLPLLAAQADKYSIIRSMYELLGIDPDGPLPYPHGMDVKVMPSSDDGDGRLHEIV